MIDYSTIPPYVMDELKAWVRDGRPMGTFCQAVVSNDLTESFARAREEDLPALHSIVGWLYNHAPRQCWGSKEALTAWPEKIRARTEVWR